MYLHDLPALKAGTLTNPKPNYRLVPLKELQALLEKTGRGLKIDDWCLQHWESDAVQVRAHAILYMISAGRIGDRVKLLPVSKGQVLQNLVLECCFKARHPYRTQRMMKALKLAIPHLEPGDLDKAYALADFRKDAVFLRDSVRARASHWSLEELLEELNAAA